ncbi:MAG: hypothetical protein ACO3CZ_06640 [Vulcanococcus sp.]
MASNIFLASLAASGLLVAQVAPAVAAPGSITNSGGKPSAAKLFSATCNNIRLVFDFDASHFRVYEIGQKVGPGAGPAVLEQLAAEGDIDTSVGTGPEAVAAWGAINGFGRIWDLRTQAGYERRLIGIYTPRYFDAAAGINKKSIGFKNSSNTTYKFCDEAPAASSKPDASPWRNMMTR